MSDEASLRAHFCNQGLSFVQTGLYIGNLPAWMPHPGVENCWSLVYSYDSIGKFGDIAGYQMDMQIKELATTSKRSFGWQFDGNETKSLGVRLSRHANQDTTIAIATLSTSCHLSLLLKHVRDY